MTATVLIVDDSLTVRMDLSEAFEAAGFLPILCATAQEARDTLAHTEIALAILDVLLPDGDGVDLLAELRRTPTAAHAAVLMLSGEAEIKDRIRGLQTGADEYVGKPYDRNYVIARARELVRSHEASPSSRPPQVLVIDDSATFRNELKGALEAAGYQVLSAATGEEGLRLAAEQRPTAVVVDGLLPGMDGATVIRRMRLDAALRHTPCLLLTASENIGDELHALDAGADAFVRKEDDVSVVLARLAAMLRSSPGEVAAEHTQSLLSPKRILAVDDSLTYLHEVSGALRGEGYDVVLAHSGEEALGLLGIQSVDCILLDLLMPGLGGKETCRRIKSAPTIRDIPLIMLTALEGRQAMIDGLGAGADDYISKASELDVLKARVRAQIRRKQFEDENRRIREELLLKELESTQTRAAQELAETRAKLVEELERKNRELEAFSYSVSHDLRAPLRSIDGFSQALLEDNLPQLDARGQDYLQRVRAAAQRMGELIDDLLKLSRVSRGELNRQSVDLSALAEGVVIELQKTTPTRQVKVVIQEGIHAEADRQLIRVALENLLGNAWKFSAKLADATVEFGVTRRNGCTVYFVRDNGAGFSMDHVDKLFRPFQRLHSSADFPGTGIGLATVQRIIDRHGGRVWAEGAFRQGASFYFTLSSAQSGGEPEWLAPT